MQKVEEKNSDAIKHDINKIYTHILGDCLGYAQLSVDGTVRNLPSIPAGAVMAMIAVESTITSGVAIRYREDGTNPTTTVGFPYVNGSYFSVDGKGNISKFKIIQAGAGTHTISVNYY